MNFLPDGIVKTPDGFMEIVPWCLYDSCDLPSVKEGVHQCQLFCKPIGAVPARDVGSREGCLFTRWLRTNMLEPSVISGKQFVVHQLNVLFLNDGRPLRVFDADIYGRTWVCFSIQQKTYWRSPATLCPSPLAIFQDLKSAHPDIPNAAQFFHPHTSFCGMPIHGLVLNDRDEFEVTLQIEGAIPERMQVAVHLDGPLGRMIV